MKGLRKGKHQCLAWRQKNNGAIKRTGMVRRSGLQVKNDDFPFWHVKLEMTKEKSKWGSPVAAEDVSDE